MKRILFAPLGALILLAGLLAVAAMSTAQASQGAEDCVPRDAYTETSGWVTESPGPGWYQVDSRTVQGEIITEGHWQRYSWTGGPHGPDSAPAFPSADWQANVQGDPHNVGSAGAYYRSSGNSGKGDWFYLEWVDPVYGEVTEYKFAFDHEAVICEPDPVVCPEGTDKAGQEVPDGKTIEEFCDETGETDVLCPDGTDKAGQKVPAGKTIEEFCDEPDEPVLCPDGTDKAGQEVPDGKTIEEFCDKADEPKVVVCKFVGKPPGTLHHIIIVSLNALEGEPSADEVTFPWPFKDAQDSFAIRFAEPGEQAKDVDLAECKSGPPPPPPVVCPQGTDNAGQVIPAGQTIEEFCDTDVGGVSGGDKDPSDVGGIVEERGGVSEGQQAPAPVSGLPNTGA